MFCVRRKRDLSSKKLRLALANCSRGFRFLHSSPTDSSHPLGCFYLPSGYSYLYLPLTSPMEGGKDILAWRHPPLTVTTASGGNVEGGGVDSVVGPGSRRHQLLRLVETAKKKSGRVYESGTLQDPKLPLEIGTLRFWHDTYGFVLRKQWSLPPESSRVSADDALAGSNDSKSLFLGKDDLADGWATEPTRAQLMIYSLAPCGNKLIDYRGKMYRPHSSKLKAIAVQAGTIIDAATAALLDPSLVLHVEGLIVAPTQSVEALTGSARAFLLPPTSTARSSRIASPEDTTAAPPLLPPAPAPRPSARLSTSIQPFPTIAPSYSPLLGPTTTPDLAPLTQLPPPGTGTFVYPPSWDSQLSHVQTKALALAVQHQLMDSAQAPASALANALVSHWHAPPLPQQPPSPSPSHAHAHAHEHALAQQQQQQQQTQLHSSPMWNTFPWAQQPSPAAGPSQWAQHQQQQWARGGGRGAGGGGGVGVNAPTAEASQWAAGAFTGWAPPGPSPAPPQGPQTGQTPLGPTPLGFPSSRAPPWGAVTSSERTPPPSHWGVNVNVHDADAPAAAAAAAAPSRRADAATYTSSAEALQEAFAAGAAYMTARAEEERAAEQRLLRYAAAAEDGASRGREFAPAEPFFSPYYTGVTRAGQTHPQPHPHPQPPPHPHTHSYSPPHPHPHPRPPPYVQPYPQHAQSHSMPPFGGTQGLFGYSDPYTAPLSTTSMPVQQHHDISQLWGQAPVPGSAANANVSAATLGSSGLASPPTSPNPNQ